MNTPKIIYWISTGLVCALMLFSAGMYIFQHDAIVEAFNNLGYPAHLVYPLAVAKILAIIAILTKKSIVLKEWAYAGLFFDFVLATMAHLTANDGQFGLALAALVMLIVSYYYDRKLFPGLKNGSLST